MQLNNLFFTSIQAQKQILKFLGAGSADINASISISQHELLKENYEQKLIDVKEAQKALIQQISTLRLYRQNIIKSFYAKTQDTLSIIQNLLQAKNCAIKILSIIKLLRNLVGYPVDEQLQVIKPFYQKFDEEAIIQIEVFQAMINICYPFKTNIIDINPRYDPIEVYFYMSDNIKIVRDFWFYLQQYILIKYKVGVEQLQLYNLEQYKKEKQYDEQQTIAYIKDQCVLHIFCNQHQLVPIDQQQYAYICYQKQYPFNEIYNTQYCLEQLHKNKFSKNENFTEKLKEKQLSTSQKTNLYQQNIGDHIYKALFRQYQGKDLEDSKQKILQIIQNRAKQWDVLDKLSSQLNNIFIEKSNLISLLSKIRIVIHDLLSMVLNFYIILPNDYMFSQNPSTVYSIINFIPQACVLNAVYILAGLKMNSVNQLEFFTANCQHTIFGVVWTEIEYLTQIITPEFKINELEILRTILINEQQNKRQQIK